MNSPTESIPPPEEPSVSGRPLGPHPQVRVRATAIVLVLAQDIFSQLRVIPRHYD